MAMDLKIYRKEKDKYSEVTLLESLQNGWVKESYNELKSDRNTRICQGLTKNDIHGNQLFIGDVVIFKATDHIVTYHIDRYEFGVTSRDLTKFYPFSGVEDDDMVKIGNILTMDDKSPVNIINMVINRKAKSQYKNVSFVSNYQLS